MNHMLRRGRWPSYLVVGGLLLAGCSTQSKTNGVESVVTATEAAPTPSASDDSLERALQLAGVTEQAIGRLADVAKSTGYVSSEVTREGESGRSFAYMAVLECREVQAGDKTWEGSYEEAVTTGADPADALRMTRHLQYVFCPGVD